MADQSDEFTRTYDVFECSDGECAAGAIGDRYIDLTYWVRTSSGELIEMEGNHQARVYAGLRALLGDIPLLEDREVVPVDVAIKGKPMITTYLFAAHTGYYRGLGWGRRGQGRRELAKTIGVRPDTIQKYLRRISKKAEEKRIDGDFPWRGW